MKAVSPQTIHALQDLNDVMQIVLEKVGNIKATLEESGEPELALVSNDIIIAASTTYLNVRRILVEQESIIDHITP